MEKKMDISATVISIFTMVCVTSLHVGRSATNDTFIWQLRHPVEVTTNTNNIVVAVKGLLQVRKNLEKWMAICDSWVNRTVLNVACRQMGYLEQQSMDVESIPRNDILRQNFSCPTGDEESTNSCTLLPDSSDKCPPYIPGGIKSLAVKTNCTTDLGLYRLLYIKLKDGDVHRGTVEYMHTDGTATTVCYNDSNAESVASVVCKQMGYSDMVNASHVHVASFTANKSVNLECTGKENTLASCTLKNDATCPSGYILATECKLNMTSQNFFDVRLSSPDNSASEGTVEIWKYGRWGVLCDTDWTIEDADVACRQLGYSQATNVSRNAMYGQGSGVVFWDKVNCTGHEFSIAECPHSIAVESETCDSTKAAGVNCSTIKKLTSNYICTNETTSISIPAGYSFLRFPDRFSYEIETTFSCQSTNLAATTNISIYIQKKMFTENHVESLTFYDNSSHWTLYGDNSSAGPFHFTETDNFAIQFKSDTSAGKGKLNILIKASDGVAFNCTKALSAIDITATSTAGTSVGPGKETPVVSAALPPESH